MKCFGNSAAKLKILIYSSDRLHTNIRSITQPPWHLTFRGIQWQARQKRSTCKPSSVDSEREYIPLNALRSISISYVKTKIYKIFTSPITVWHFFILFRFRDGRYEGFLVDVSVKLGRINVCQFTGANFLPAFSWTARRRNSSRAA